MLAVLFLSIFLSFGSSKASSCGTEQGCNCTFSDESMFDTKSEIMAASIGAMGPLLLTGIGFAVWKFIQGRTPSIPFERAPSELSEDSMEEKPRRSAKGSGRVTPRGPTPLSEYSYARRNSSSTPLSITDDTEYIFNDSPRGSIDASITEQGHNGKWSSPPAPASKDAPLNNWMF